MNFVVDGLFAKNRLSLAMAFPNLTGFSHVPAKRLWLLRGAKPHGCRVPLAQLALNAYSTKFV